MPTRTSKSALAFISLTLGLMLPAAASAQGVDPAPTLGVSPNPARADKAFTLTLLGVASDCYSTFARESVTVADGRINLSYVKHDLIFIAEPGKPQSDPIRAPVCPVYDDPRNDTLKAIPPNYQGPRYKMPALKAGSYEVWATEMYECLYTQPSCKIAVRTVSAGTLVVKAEGAIAYTINPGTVYAGKDFELNLFSYSFNCATTFDSLAVNVVGEVITLSFLDHVKPGSVCPDIYKPYGPTYKVPGLKAGTYKVKAYRHPACLPCKMLGETVDAGTLIVKGDVVRSGWFLKNSETPAEKPFTLQLLNNDYGNCQTSFSHKTVSNQGNGIYTSFLVETNKDHVCIVDIHPYGPDFDMQGLKAGIYPVYATELLACQVTAPFCAIKTPVPNPFDTLVVTKALAVLLSDLRAHTPQVDLQGSRASMILPEGIGGTWKAELLTVNGQRISSASVNSEAGVRAEFDLGMKPERGVYLMRLSAPDGETHMIPLIRKD
jgi:hypothetical protein